MSGYPYLLIFVVFIVAIAVAITQGAAHAV